MKTLSSIKLIIFVVIALILIPACSHNNLTDNGVARADKQEMETPNSEKLEGQPQAANKSDELVTTEFTICMRNNGFNIADPEVFADGTVNLEFLKQNISEDPTYLEYDSKIAMGECLPILENATFSGRKEPESLVELQDNLLLFTECLRETGVKVNDPSISEDLRYEMKYILQDVNLDKKSTRDKVNSCSSVIYGSNLVEGNKDGTK